MITRITVVSAAETRAFEPKSEDNNLDYAITHYGQYAVLTITETNLDDEVIFQHIFKDWATITVISNGQ